MCTAAASIHIDMSVYDKAAQKLLEGVMALSQLSPVSFMSRLVPHRSIDVAQYWMQEILQDRSCHKRLAPARMRCWLAAH